MTFLIRTNDKLSTLLAENDVAKSKVLYTMNLFMEFLYLKRKKLFHRKRLKTVCGSSPERKYEKKYMNNLDDTDTLMINDPNQTYWYRNYVYYPNLSCLRFQRKFRLRFRLPYKSYAPLLNKVCDHAYYNRWDDRINIKNKLKGSPIVSLLLGSLRYL